MILGIQYRILEPYNIAPMHVSPSITYLLQDMERQCVGWPLFLGMECHKEGLELPGSVVLLAK